MPVEQTAEITHSAYELAWQEFINFAGLSVDERRTGTNQLRWYILMIAVGERDPSKIAGRLWDDAAIRANYTLEAPRAWTEHLFSSAITKFAKFPLHRVDKSHVYYCFLETPRGSRARVTV